MGIYSLYSAVPSGIGNGEYAIVRDKFKDYFMGLCVSYGTSLCNPKPLKIDTLRLGRGMCLLIPNSEEDQESRYLSRLLEIRSLKTLHPWNEHICELETNPDYVMYELYLEVLSGGGMLKQLSVMRLTGRIASRLATGGQEVEELTVTNDSESIDEDLSLGGEIPAGKLKMVFCYVKSRRCPPYEMKLTVLDRLVDKGLGLERLCVSLDFEVHWETFERHLPDMKELKQLRLERPTDNFRAWPNIPKGALVEIIALPKRERREGLVRYIASLCPALRHVMLEQDAWRIWSDGEGRR